MRCAIVIGANYGDEGKGRVTSQLFCDSKVSRKLNILTNGGAQRGHTVVKPCGRNKISHVFHHFGSGTFDGADTLCSKQFILNPMVYVDELFSLEELGFSIPTLLRHKKCRWSTPFDMMANQILELSRGDESHGSCGKGIWKTIKRYNYGLQVSFDDFCDAPTEYQKKFLHQVRDYYVKEGIFTESEICKRYPLFEESLIDRFIFDCKYMQFRSRAVSDEVIKTLLESYDYIVFENGQGLLLNDDINNVHTTPSNTDCTQVSSFIESYLTCADVEVVYVSRPYLTRHGNGILEGECSPINLSGTIFEKTNVTNTFQGDFRYAPINLQELFSRVEKSFSQCFNGVSRNRYHATIAFTHVDELSDEQSYISNVNFLKESKSLQDVSNIYHMMFIRDECSGSFSLPYIGVKKRRFIV